MTNCHCGSGRPFDECCGPYLSGASVPPTPEALMRSRYSAFATANVAYLGETLLPGTQDDFDADQVTEWAKNSQWTGLEVRSTADGKDADEAFVEFVAKFVMDGKELIHHETGRFQKQDGRWWYVDGIMGQRPRTVVKVGRNDPCICGSGKKYKKCCGA